MNLQNDYMKRIMLCQILRSLLLPFTILEFPWHHDAQFSYRSVHCIMGVLARFMLHQPILKSPLLQYFILAYISGHDNHFFLLLVHFIRGGIVGLLPNQIEASGGNKEPSHTQRLEATYAQTFLFLLEGPYFLALIM